MKPVIRTGAAAQQLQSERIILIVDDEKVIRDLCSKALGGYHILQAGDGREALNLLAGQPVDLVLTDIMMTGMNGLELLEEIKNHAPNQAVVMMTGYGDKEIILRALKLNADDFISKPINLLQLRTLVAKVLERVSLREELVQLKKMDQLKSEFLGLVSHKLKTPATVISLFIQNLVQDNKQQFDADFSRNLTLIQEESDYLTSLIQDLLRYSGSILQTRPVRHETTDMVALATRCLIEYQNNSASQDTTLINNLPAALPLLAVDRVQIAFCLRALLDNAVKFSPGGGRISLSALADEQHLAVSVSDEGPGIAAEQQTKIFEKFYQIDPDNTGQIRGFGLGLFYAREFLKAHHGRLSLKSQPGHGSTFTLQLPLAAPASPPYPS